MTSPNKGGARAYLGTMDDSTKVPIMKAALQASAPTMSRVAHGHCSLRVTLPSHFLHRGRAHPVSRRRRQLCHAHGHLSGDQDTGGDGDLELHRAQHAGDGTARHDLQPVFDQRQCQRHQGHRGADDAGIVGPEDLLPARRQHRPRNRADRRRHQRHPRPDAARHPAADRGPVQRLERAGAADQPELRHPERAAALRLRHLPHAPAARADSRRHPADAVGRQVPPDHGRHRPDQARRQGPDAARRRQRRQYPEPHPAGGHGQDRHDAVCRSHQRDAVEHPRPQRHPDQGRERRHRLREGRRPGP